MLLFHCARTGWRLVWQDARKGRKIHTIVVYCLSSAGSIYTGVWHYCKRAKQRSGIAQINECAQTSLLLAASWPTGLLLRCAMCSAGKNRTQACSRWFELLNIAPTDCKMHETVREVSTCAMATLPRPSAERSWSPGGRETHALDTTLHAVPRNNATAEKAALPIGVQLNPLAPDGKGGAVKVASALQRCSRCRGYASTHTAWLSEDGSQWTCALCRCLNASPTSWCYPSNRSRSPELTLAAIDAPLHCTGASNTRQAIEHPVCTTCAVKKRAVFAIDASRRAVTTGANSTACAASRLMLDAGIISNGCCGVAGVLTFNSFVRFYSSKQAVYEVPDIELNDAHSGRGSASSFAQALCPEPSKVLSADISAVNELLRRVDSDADAHAGHEAASICRSLKALRCAIQLASADATSCLLFEQGSVVYGRVVLFSACADSDSVSDEEADSVARLACAHNVRVDLFVLAQANGIQLQMLERIVRATGGELHWHTPFNVAVDTGVIYANARICATNSQAINGAMKVRTASGLRIAGFHGPGDKQHHGIVKIPCVRDATSLSCHLEHNGSLYGVYTYVQAALAYVDSTTAENRVLVHTMTLSVADTAKEVLDNANGDTCLMLLQRSVLMQWLRAELSSQHRLRSSLVTALVKPCAAYRKVESKRNVPSSHKLAVPTALELVPLYMNGALKLPAFCGQEICAGEQFLWIFRLLTAGKEHLKACWYPRLMSVHDADPVAYSNGMLSMEEDDTERALRLPPSLWASAAKVSTSGVFMLEDGWDVFLHTGRFATPTDIYDIFGVVDANSIDESVGLPPRNDSAVSTSTHGMLSEICYQRGFALRLRLACNGNAADKEFHARLVEDYNEYGSAHLEFLSVIHRGVKQQVDSDIAQGRAGG